ncbi:MAG: S41 family peptidase [Nitrospirae bacterium]|nr:S41 family peptidase [Nitrospirota bacterium]
MKRVGRQAVLSVLGLVTMLFAGVLIGKTLEGRSIAAVETYDKLRVFAEVLSQLEKNYVEPIDSAKLVDGALQGMVNTLDPHSAYMPPDVYREIQVDTKGEFGGLGIQIGLKENRLVVIAPIEGTPADRAGVKAGDLITEIEGGSTKNMTLTDAVNKLRGPKGTKVSLTLRREGQTAPIKVTLTRETIKIQSVKSQMMDDHIGYVRLTQFQEQTSADLKVALKRLVGEGAQSLILDLRNNPGGLLTSAVEVSEQFLPKSKLVVSIRGRNETVEEYRANGESPVVDLPMIILVNAGSASASEIVSGALQDWGRAILLGTTTFGKGSVQTIIALSDGSGLRLTTAKYYTPKDRSIHGIGIVPDIVVAGRDEGAHKVIREQDLLRRQNGGPEEEVPPADAAPDPNNQQMKVVPEGQQGKDDKDPQLEKAVELLKSWRIFKSVVPEAVPTPGSNTDKKEAKSLQKK